MYSIRIRYANDAGCAGALTIFQLSGYIKRKSYFSHNCNPYSCGQSYYQQQWFYSIRGNYFSSFHKSSS